MPKHHVKKEREERRAHRRGERSAERRRGTLKAGVRFLAIVLLAFVGYSSLVEPRMVKVTEHEVPIQGLPWAFDGFTIVQVSDLHVGLWSKPGGVRKIVKRVNALRPDLVVLTGDYVTRSATNCEPAGKSLAGLKATHGVYAVLGNHDYWVDAEGVTKALRESGIDVLFDEKRRISVGSNHIWLVGTDDEWEGKPDYEKAFEGVSPGDICIVLAHNPDAVLSMKGRPVSLLLSGHTHGGLVHLPWVGPLLTITKLGPAYASGMHSVHGIRVYISRGVGLITPPVRFRCPPEIPVFTLRRVEK